MFFEKRMTEIVHALLEQYVHDGDVAVDATMGNGYDTLKLCQLVGDNGKVFAFDIQPVALEKTAMLLEANGLKDRASLMLKSHAEMAVDVRMPIAAFVFNLGYLPEGDHRVTTLPESTLTGIEAGLKLLKSGGLGIVVAYYGHDGGLDELQQVDLLLKSLGAKEYDVLKLENHNRRSTPPILYMIKRRG